MPRNYQRKKTLYPLPHDVYMTVQQYINGYDRMRKARLDVIWGSPAMDHMPRSPGVSTPTEDKAIRLAYFEEHLEAIDQSAVEIRGEYSGKVYGEFDPIQAYRCYDYFNCMFIRRHDKDYGPCRRTWNNYKDYFSAKIAHRLKLF